MQTPRDQQLADWESALGKELDSLRDRKAEVESQLQLVSKRLELVKQMRALEDSQGSANLSPANPPSTPELRATPLNIKEATKRILAEFGQPMHISEIHRKFLETGHPIPGKGTPFNLLVHLVNDKAFVRVARGTYALAGSVPAEQIMPKAQRKSSKRRRRSKKKPPRSEEQA